MLPLIRRLGVPVLALCAAVGTVSVVVMLQRRAHAVEAARVSVAQLQVELAGTESTEVRQAMTGAPPLQIAAAAGVQYDRVDDALASLARAHPTPELAAARAELTRTRAADVRAGALSERYSTRPNKTVLPPPLAGSYVRTADARLALQQALGRVSRAYAREAARTLGQADWGSVGGVAVLLSLFLVFYVRSQRARAMAATQASSDPLTGLGNRRRLFRDLAAAQLEGRSSTLVLIDLDGFKQYNDSRGHVAGDELLRLIASRLDEVGGPAGSAYRLGGDEFLLVLPGVTSETVVAEIIARVQDQFKLNVGLSHGTSELTPGEPLDLAMRRADDVMYRNKIRKRLADEGASERGSADGSNSGPATGPVVVAPSM